MAFLNKAVMAQLHSINQRDVAVALSDMLIEQETNEWVKENIKKIRDIVWDNNAPAATDARSDYLAEKNRRQKNGLRIHEIMNTAPDAESKKQLAEDYARFGHLYEIAGHVARENYFLEREEKLKDFTNDPDNAGKTPENDIVAPGGMHDLLYHNDAFKHATVDQAIDMLNAPVSEYIFTQHPTNTNTLESMRLQRDIAHHIEDLIKTDNALRTNGAETDLSMQSLKDLIGEFARKPIISESNFTAKDETDIVINFLSNAYHDLDRLYEVTERGLSRKFGEDYDDEKRASLDLQLRFGSWGSAGDKDGNGNIKSENTLEAIVLHKREAAKLFSADLEAVDNLPAELKPWLDQLREAEKEFTSIIAVIEEKRAGKNDIPFSKEDFTEITQRVQQASDQLGKSSDFLNEITHSYDNPANDSAKENLLSLKRKVQTFGFNLGKIEYRETAEEYERALAFLLKRKEVQDYSFAPEAKEFIDAYESIAKERGLAQQEKRKENKDVIEKAERTLQSSIVRIMNDPHAQEALTKLAGAFMEEADATQLRNYKDKESGDAAITYHTIRRMELARDFDGMITHNVLAEAKGTHSLLEALAMQMTTTQPDGRRALMHIVPLFEEADTMEKIPDVIKGGLENYAYHQHIEALKTHFNDAGLTQQIQIAHSDNARRAGAIASRGIIHEGHRAAREAIEKYNDAHQDAPVNLQFFEGGSLSDSYRNGVRAATAMIRDFGLAKLFKATFQGGDLLNYFNQSTSMKRLTLRNIVQQAELLATNTLSNGQHSKLEAVIVDGISDLQRQYNESIYDHPANPLGIVLHALDYRAQAAAGSAGTRGNRNAVPPEGEDITGVDPKNMRTIGFSEALQHGNIHPSCLGTDLLVDVLRQKFADNAEARAELQQGFAEYKEKNALPMNAVPLDNLGQVTSAGLNYLYKEGSPSFKDAIDKMAYSLVNTRIAAFTNKLESYQQKIKREEGTRDETLDKAFHAIMREYDDASRLVYRSLSGKDITNDDRQRFANSKSGVNNDTISTVDNIIYMVKKLPELAHLAMHHHKHGFLDGLDAIEKTADLENSRITHNARDTVYHGRTFTADDPRYGKAIVNEPAFIASNQSVGIAV